MVPASWARMASCSCALLFALLVPASALAQSVADAGPIDAGARPESQEEIEVVGHYENAIGTSDAASEGRITRQLVEDRPILRPGEVLELVPGLIITQHSGSGKANQYFLRGFNLDHGTDFATFVDGMPVNQPTHAHGHGYSDLNLLIPELVRRIDYRKGPYFASDGDFASAGSARLSLMDELPRGLAQLTLGEHGRRALLAQSGGHWLGALELQGNDGPWVEPERLHKLNGWLRWSDNSERVQRSVTLMAYNARWNATDQIPARAALDSFASLDPSDGGRTQRISLSAQQRVTLDDGDWRVSAYAIGSRLNLWSNFTYFLDDPVNGDQFEQAERRHTHGGEASRRWSFELVGREAQLTVGAQARDDRLSPIGLYRTVRRERAATTQEQQVRQREFGVYGEFATTWTPWLRSIAGLRTDRWQARVEGLGSRSASLTSSKLSLVFGPWRQTEAFVNWGTGFHSNDARGALAATDPAPPLVKSRGAELGLRSEIVPGLQSSLARAVAAGTRFRARLPRRCRQHRGAARQPPPWRRVEPSRWGRPDGRPRAQRGEPRRVAGPHVRRPRPLARRVRAAPLRPARPGGRRLAALACDDARIAARRLAREPRRDADGGCLQPLRPPRQ